jgi:hypothetical protein
MVSGNMPAFSVNTNVTQTLTASTGTKIQFNLEDFDTANAFDSTTNYRFTPQVAGYYQINLSVCVATTSTSVNAQAAISKNGSLIKYGSTPVGSTYAYAVSNVNTVVYLNGSTDYIEGYFYNVYNVNQTSFANSGYTCMSGSLVRTA